MANLTPQMDNPSLTIIHLLHNMKVGYSAIIADDFEESLNVNIDNPSFAQKCESLHDLQNNGYVHIDKDGYIGLTQKGGKFWESEFLIDWDLYFEYGSQFINDKELTFFYAINKETVQLAIDTSNGLFDDCKIQITQNWQPIYWKKPLNGFYIEKALDSELLPCFYDILPNYCQNL